jgi:hypothetical protein
VLKQNKFGHHNVGEQPSMIENFNHPFLWRLKLFNHHKKAPGEGGLSHVFGKPSMKAFQIDATS